MQLPKPLVDAADAASAANPDDVHAAVRAALAAIKRLPEYAGAVEALVFNAVSELVYDSRHKVNVRIKRSIGYYGGPAKVDHADAKVRTVYASVGLRLPNRRQDVGTLDGSGTAGHRGA